MLKTCDEELTLLALYSIFVITLSINLTLFPYFKLSYDALVTKYFVCVTKDSFHYYKLK